MLHFFILMPKTFNHFCASTFFYVYANSAFFFILVTKFLYYYIQSWYLIFIKAVQLVQEEWLSSAYFVRCDPLKQNSLLLLIHVSNNSYYLDWNEFILWYCDSIMILWPNPQSFISLLQPQAQESKHELLKFWCCLYWVYMHVTVFCKHYPLHTWRSNFCLVFGFFSSDVPSTALFLHIIWN